MLPRTWESTVRRSSSCSFFFSPCALSLIRSMPPWVLGLVKRLSFMPKTMSMRIFSRNLCGPGGQRNLPVSLTLPLIPGWSFVNRYSRSSTRPSEIGDHVHANFLQEPLRAWRPKELTSQFDIAAHSRLVLREQVQQIVHTPFRYGKVEARGFTLFPLTSRASFMK